MHCGTLDGTSALDVGAVLNSKIINRKHKKYEKHGTKYKTQRRLVIVIELKQQDRGLHLVHFNLETRALGKFTLFATCHMSANDRKVTPRVLILGLQIIFSE